MKKEYRIYALRMPPYSKGKESYSFLVFAENELDAHLEAKKILVNDYDVDPTKYHINKK